MATQLLQCEICSHIDHFDLLHAGDARCTDCGCVSKGHYTYPDTNSEGKIIHQIKAPAPLKIILPENNLVTLSLDLDSAQFVNAEHSNFGLLRGEPKLTSYYSSQKIEFNNMNIPVKGAVVMDVHRDVCKVAFQISNSEEADRDNQCNQNDLSEIVISLFPNEEDIGAEPELRIETGFYPVSFENDNMDQFITSVGHLEGIAHRAETSSVMAYSIHSQMKDIIGFLKNALAYMNNIAPTDKERHIQDMIKRKDAFLSIYRPLTTKEARTIFDKFKAEEHTGLVKLFIQPNQYFEIDPMLVYKDEEGQFILCGSNKAIKEPIVITDIDLLKAIECSYTAIGSAEG